MKVQSLNLKLTSLCSHLTSHPALSLISSLSLVSPLSCLASYLILSCLTCLILSHYSLVLSLISSLCLQSFPFRLITQSQANLQKLTYPMSMQKWDETAEQPWVPLCYFVPKFISILVGTFWFFLVFWKNLGGSHRNEEQDKGVNLDTTAKVESQFYFKWISRKSWKYQSLDDMRAKCLEEDFFMLNIRKLQQTSQLLYSSGREEFGGQGLDIEGWGWEWWLRLGSQTQTHSL